ncbi:hypothetical protein D8O27_16630 [Burkholderia mallei]|nr:hypothetical protein D8O31_17700 [Burkholderia mallei]RKO10903.1 hypothetical protein D8O04_19620 [Burkholderia mallei]RKO20659.1 hypothetical protein D8O30_13790 [Burkholderia mallei]RKO28631.1 hypothetical protein D8O27_16630 [Burkholderia mallei]RKO39744.1 hypothetical protein D8O06_16520 [Burkholderia mallei]
MRRGVGGGYCPARTANREPRTEHRASRAADCLSKNSRSRIVAHRPPPTAHAIAPPPSTSTVDPVA